MYEQALIQVENDKAFGDVRQAIEQAFSNARRQEFLGSIARSGLRIRDFERVLAKGLLGAGREASYKSLGNGDQGMIRELYLETAEKVPFELRRRFMKIYTYY